MPLSKLSTVLELCLPVRNIAVAFFVVSNAMTTYCCAKPHQSLKCDFIAPEVEAPKPKRAGECAVQEQGGPNVKIGNEFPIIACC